jgi:sulfide:quinone oxidoreductase
MTDFRNVTEAFSVASQLDISDLAAAKAAGFKTIICNRPNHEGGPEQPTIEAMKAEAESLGLSFLALPFSGAPSLEIASQQGSLVDAAAQPVLAYCRSGTRSITAWALSQRGQGRAQEVLKAGQDAGYDLSGLADFL